MEKRAVVRTCECGAQFTTLGTSGRKLCDDCTLKRKRAAALASYYRQQAKLGKPRLGDTLVGQCIYCPAEFTYVLRRGRREVCDDCKRRKGGQARAAWAERYPDSIAAIKRRYAQNHPLKAIEATARGRYLRYQVTPEWEAETLRKQGGKCGNPGCGATEPGGRWQTWNIDHDHLTGKPRGLLCSRCNKGVGLFDDDEAKLLGMVEYIRQHRQLVT